MLSLAGAARSLRRRPAPEASPASGAVCVAEAWQGLARDVFDASGAPFAAAGSWREGMRALAWAGCRFLEEDRERARALIELSFASEAVEASRDFAMDAYAELIHRGCHERPEAAAVSRAWAEGIAGATWQRIAVTVTSDRFEELPHQTPQLMYLTVFPYLGAVAAREELRRGPDDIARYRRGRL
jgi:hypothetical protein